LDIIHLETVDLGCKPTEVRHLIGRLGEFYCAIAVNGKLAHTANQHGFDVISAKGEKVSVKTTAQKSGFVSINKKTMGHFDKLMILQFKDMDLEILYYGDMNVVEKICRTWKGNYELDITKAKKLHSKSVI